MTVITISRELGSEGDQIAELLCEALEYRRVDKAILLHVAEEAGVDVEAVLAKERGFANKARLISGDMASLYRREPAAFERGSDLDDQTYAEVVQRAMTQYAEQGDVIIVGRGGQMILRDWPLALHVHVYAPVEIRIQRVMRRFNISEPEARRRVSQSDEQKRQYIRHMHRNADWKNLKYYHLMIQTNRVAPAVAVQIIILAARNLEVAASGA